MELFFTISTKAAATTALFFFCFTIVEIFLRYTEPDILPCTWFDELLELDWPRDVTVALQWLANVGSTLYVMIVAKVGGYPLPEIAYLVLVVNTYGVLLFIGRTERYQ